MKPTIEQVREYMDRDLETKLPPDPYEIALTFTAALLSSGAFGDDRSAACESAWRLVIPFYQGKLAYEQDVAMRAQLAAMHRDSVAVEHVNLSASDVEGQMSTEEARAYVTGGETGAIGETAPGDHPVKRIRMQQAFVPPDPEAMAKQTRIVELAHKVARLQEAYQQAEALGQKSKAAKLRKEFDEACKEQSEAYL